MGRDLNQPMAFLSLSVSGAADHQIYCDVPPEGSRVHVHFITLHCFGANAGDLGEVWIAGGGESFGARLVSLIAPSANYYQQFVGPVDLILEKHQTIGLYSHKTAAGSKFNAYLLYSYEPVDIAELQANYAAPAAAAPSCTLFQKIVGAC